MVVCKFFIIIIVSWLFTLLQFVDWLGRLLLICRLVNNYSGVSGSSLLGFLLVELLIFLTWNRWCGVGVVQLTQVLKLVWSQVKFRELGYQ